MTSFIDVRDIGAVAAKVLTYPGHEKRAYTLTGNEALDYDQKHVRMGLYIFEIQVKSRIDSSGVSGVDQEPRGGGGSIGSTGNKPGTREG